MGCSRVLLCVVFPPLAVLDRGCGSVVIVALLTLFGWVPGVIAAIVLCRESPNPSITVVYPGNSSPQPPPAQLPIPSSPPVRKKLSLVSIFCLFLVGLMILSALVSLMHSLHLK